MTRVLVALVLLLAPAMVLLAPAATHHWAAPRDGGTGAGASSHEATAAARGKQIYTRGQSPRGRAITATVLAAGTVPAARYPCALCHGSDGRGGWEGGVRIPEIRWERLRTRSAGTGPGAPARPAYTLEALGTAIRHGHDPAGRALEALMPRYAIDDEDLADLAAYLRRLGSEHAPGTSADTIRVGVLLPLQGAMAAHGAAIRRVLERYVARIDDAGGVHGRSLTLVVHDAGASQEQAVAAARRMLDSEGGVFCVLAAAGPGAGPAVQAFLAERRVPSIGPLSLVPAEQRHHSVFHLIGKLDEQARVAARHASDSAQAGDAPVAVVSTLRAQAQRMNAAFLDEAARRGLPVATEPMRAREELPALVARLRAQGSTLLVYWGDAETATRLIEEAARQGWQPDLLASSVLLDGAMVPRRGRVFLVAPPLAPGLSASRGVGFSALAAPEARADAGASEPGSGLGAEHRAMQMAAFAAAEVLVAGLEMAGRELGREALVAALERLRDFPTGVLPPITFDRVRRQGVRGALIVGYDDGGRALLDYRR